MKVRTRLLAMMLAIIMIVSIIPVGALAGNGKGKGGGHGYGHDKELPAIGGGTNDSVVVIAASDYQASGGNSASAQIVKNISAKIDAAYGDADGLIFCGDYDYNNNSQKVSEGISSLRSALSGYFPGITENAKKDSDYEIFVQGNHDVIAQGAQGLSKSGEHDTPDYGVFVIDEDDYGTYWGHKATSAWNNDDGVDDFNNVKAVADALGNYLTAKAAEGYSKPIFVAAHLPLHFSTRTLVNGDNKYAHLILDKLIAGGKAGLNIFYVCGHNHSRGYDDYLGGAAYCFKSGDSIEVAKCNGDAGNYKNYSTSEHEAVTLNFTYMNAGYVGYYDDKNDASDNDTTLTMSVFEITDSQVKITRYDANGVHDLKSKGYDTTYNYDGNNAKMNMAYTNVLGSPLVVALNNNGGQTGGDDDDSDEPTVVVKTDETTGVSVSSTCSGELTVKTVDTLSEDVITAMNSTGAYKAFDIKVEDFVNGTDSATVKLPVGGLTGNLKVFHVAENGEVEYMGGEVEGEYITFTTNHFSTFVVTAVAASEGWIEITVDPKYGSVVRDSKKSTITGSTITVTFVDGTTAEVPVTLEMISGDYDITTPGTYEGLTVTYEGKTFTNYTLTVLPKPSENDYPEYPDQGSVRVNKTGEGIDWYETGVAKVELSATGIPVNKGVDVIVMLDTSSSMGRDKNNQDTKVEADKRITKLQNSLSELLTTFQQPNEDGSENDIRIAIADFNGYTNLAGQSQSDVPTIDYMKGFNTRQPNNALVYTNGKQKDVLNKSDDIIADAFVKPTDINVDKLNAAIKNNLHSGTNYDYAFDKIYELGSKVKAYNNENGEARELYVIFMSDGSPYQYNYFYSQRQSGLWNMWLQGRMNEIPAGADVDYLNGAPYSFDSYESATATTTKKATEKISNATHKYFYNTDQNKHWMAEAIKGDPEANYKVILPSTETNGRKPAGENNMYLVPGLGATMYTIGFCLGRDQNTLVESVEYVIRNIASEDENGDKLYYDAQDQDQLDVAFQNIAGSIKQAATNARFVDTMGDDYDLQMASKVGKETSDGGVVVTLAEHGITPTIEVKEYDIYKKSDVGTNGVTDAMVGQRKGTYNTLEKVTFNADGSEAYSDKIGGGKENILSNGVICAKTFYYNTTSSEVTVDGIKIAPETFYWKIGTIGEKEIALSYYVYLTGSMEGTRPAGSYPTNEDATLYYTNWLNHEAQKTTVSPVLPWGAANVSYAFYLVDKDGNVIVNQSTGETGSFANKVAVTTPVTQQILLNNEEQLQALKLCAGDVLPEGYTLYDNGAAYKIAVYSGEGSYWDITNTETPDTTYVTDYAADQYTTEDHNGNNVDYTHTTVWFAVMFEVGCVPDVVVIDYGLPVEINVLANDMFGKYGTLAGLAKLNGETLPSGKTNGLLNGFGFDKSAVGEFGTAEIANGKIKYQIDKENTQMKMDDLEVFAYAARYITDVDELSAYNGYYYSTVTVIPATIIYYEDDFVTFENADDRTEESPSGVWSDAGTRDSEATQAEDRPGYYSLSEIDANNLYGFDGAYQNYATYSNGSAKKVTLISGNGDNPTATFEFTGSAFDIISVTSGDTGTILVDVYKANENGGFDETYDYEWIVDTYYGYTYELTGTYEKLTWKYDGSAWHVESEEVDDLGENQEFPENPTEGNQVIRYREIGKWVKTGRGALYQIPVIKSPDLGYGTYKVVVRPSYGKFFDHTGKGQYDFFFDAVRVYNPADNGSKNSTIEKAYKDDNEAYPQYIEVRNNLIGQGYFNNDNEEQGFVFIDGFGATNDIANYTNYGPNNEVYLQNGQAVAFKLKAENGADNVASVQLSTKCVNGPTELTVINGSVTRSIKLNTSTDLYYDITSIVKWDEENDTSDEIILLNTSSNLVSITNVKITYKEEPSEPAKVFMTSASASKAVTLLRTMYIAANTAEPEEEEPIIVEPEVFTPGTFNVKVKDKIKTGEDIKVEITTSPDVAAVKVNGISAKFERTDKKSGNKVWIFTVKANEAGEMIFSVVAYDANEIASETNVKTVNVEAKEKGPGAKPGKGPAPKAKP